MRINVDLMGTHWEFDGDLMVILHGVLMVIYHGDLMVINED